MPEQIEQISKDSVAFKRQARIVALENSVRILNSRGSLKSSDITNSANLFYKWLINGLTNKSKEEEEDEAKLKEIKNAK